MNKFEAMLEGFKVIFPGDFPPVISPGDLPWRFFPGDFLLTLRASYIG